MKKCIVIALCLALLLSLAACVKDHAQPSQPAIGGGFCLRSGNIQLV